MKNANEIIAESVSQREEVYSHLREAADFFHEHEGTFFERGEAIEELSDELSITEDMAGQAIAELVSDVVDPVVLSAADGKKYVGVVEFEQFDGAYGYVDYHDVRGPNKRVVCQQCVNEAAFDTQVTHATAGDPSGTVASGADYGELLDVVHEHYENSHRVVPEDVETGATLASGTTIGGNTSFHAGNDGSGSGLDADTVGGQAPSAFVTSRYKDSEARSAVSGSSIDGSNFTGIETIEEVATFSNLPAPNPPQLAYTDDTDEYYRSFGDPANAFDITQATFTTSINSQDGAPRGIAFDNTGSRLYEVGEGGDLIYQSDLSTDFDISTATFSTSINSQDPRPTGIAFDNTGSRLYEVGAGSNLIYQSDLSTDFDISTATFSTSISTQEGGPNGIAFDNTGSRLYEVGTNSDLIYQSDLSTDFDISTATFTTSISTQDATPTGITFDSIGSRLYEVGAGSDLIYQSDLSTDFDISTATFSTSISTQDANPRGITFDAFGSRLYEVGSVGDKIYQSDLGGPRWTDF